MSDLATTPKRMTGLRALLAAAACLLASIDCSADPVVMSDSPPAQHEAAALSIVPGGITEFRVMLPENLRRFAGSGKLSYVSTAQVAVAVPANFDPGRAWPMLVVSATSDPGYSDSRALMRGFVKPALAAGWVVFAADPAEALRAPADDNNEMRYALVKAAQSALTGIWPDSARWPLAFGGFSGGAKRSGVLAFLSTVEGKVPIGIFLGGCNEPTPVWALDAYHKPLPPFQHVPIFLSSGRRDTIATPAQHEDVEQQLAAAGFTTTRLESHPGRHELYPEHIRAALRWFAAQHAD